MQGKTTQRNYQILKRNFTPCCYYVCQFVPRGNTDSMLQNVCTTHTSGAHALDFKFLFSFKENKKDFKSGRQYLNTAHTKYSPHHSNCSTIGPAQVVNCFLGSLALMSLSHISCVHTMN